MSLYSGDNDDDDDDDDDDNNDDDDDDDNNNNRVGNRGTRENVSSIESITFLGLHLKSNLDWQN
jgi:TATA-binding protein-associated factor Taf7